MNKANVPDPMIDEIRAVRHRISAECGHDPERQVTYHAKLQEQHRDRLIDVRSKDDQPAA
jgi:hypothetical protein